MYAIEKRVGDTVLRYEAPTADEVAKLAAQDVQADGRKERDRVNEILKQMLGMTNRWTGLT